MRQHVGKWIWTVDTERLYKIDLHAYRLGLFPITEEHAKAVSSSKQETASVELRKKEVHELLNKEAAKNIPLECIPSASTLFTTTPDAASVNNNIKSGHIRHNILKSRRAKRKADLLNSLPETSCPSPSLFHTTNSSEVLLKSNLRKKCEAENKEEIRPFSTLSTMRRMLREWEDRQNLTIEQEEAKAVEEEIKHNAALQHPDALFADEAAVQWRFGMGAFASPNIPGFNGLFRQHWRDFFVTEMIPDSTVDIGGKTLSRKPDWTIPPPPAELLQQDRKNSPKLDEKEEDVLPDSSFFTVRVKERIEEIIKEGDGNRTSTSSNTSHLSSDFSLEKITPPSSASSYSSPSPSCVTVDGTATSTIDIKEEVPAQKKGGRFYLQCYLHKQHTAHSVALANIAQTLRMHPAGISVAGIKDYIGDTVQRVRLENITPSSAIEANQIFRKKRWKMTLSDFSYHCEPLFPGGLFGNHFKIVLRDVAAPRDVIDKAIHYFGENGFPNYYGCQRFSWFAGREDAAFALLHHNWLAFAFRFLNYTEHERTLRELLQREKKYPNPVQDEYRRNVVRRLRRIAVEPADLDIPPFLSCPALGVPLTSVHDHGPINKKQELVILQLREAFFDLSMMSRRMTAQRLSSYLWNQVLTLRLHHFGSKDVLLGDLVIPEVFRRVETSREDRKELNRELIRLVEDESNRIKHTITDVVHPGFSFNAIQRPQNVIGEYYLQICEKYHLDWYTRHTKVGLNDFLEPPRPIIRKPINLQYEYNPSDSKLTLQFALERGSYANVAITELMKQIRCLGSDDILILPAPKALWGLGHRDTGYVTSVQDIYDGFEDGVGFVTDEHEVPVIGEGRVWDHEGPLFLPDNEDPVKKAYKWGKRHLLRNMARRIRDEESMARHLFEQPLVKTLKDGELAQYAGHTVPMPPNAKGKRIFFNILRRQRRYPGAPKPEPRLRRGAQVANRAPKEAPFKTINKNTWNVTW